MGLTGCGCCESWGFVSGASAPGLRTWVGLRASGLGFRVQGLDYRVHGLGLRVWGSGYRV